MTSFFPRPPNMSYDDYVEFIARVDAELRKLITVFGRNVKPDDPITYDKTEPLNMRDDPGFDMADFDDVMMTPDEVRALDERKGPASSEPKPPPSSGQERSRGTPR